MPGMALIEPSCEHEVGLAVRWAVEEAVGPVYIRLVSVPWELPFEPPLQERLVLGQGQVLREGRDVLLVAAGPVMLSGAWGAAELLAGGGVAAGVVAMPWLRDVDGAWLADAAGGAPVVCIDNHYVSGGQGDAVASALSGGPVHRLGVESVPLCGTNDEVLRGHALDAAGIAEAVAAVVPARA
jgi:transketolase